ncbi:MAG: hypothetical protein R6U28_13060 [Cyclonatronaceae bacterium]
MKRFTLCLLLVLGTVSTGFTQHGEYVRKSISSVESVWVQSGAKRGIRLDYPFFEKMMASYVEMPRFDYNELPEPVLRDFRQRIGEVRDIDRETLAELLQETVGKAILDILNDPEVMENRGLALRDESAWQTFAATKARSVGLTAEELEVLMNSSYIYLPYIQNIRVDDSRSLAGANDASRIARSLIRSASDDDDSNHHYVYIEGGIVWYAVNVSPQGEVSISQLLSVAADAYGSAERGKSHTFRFGNDRWELDSRKYALYEATQAWVRQLALETQQISEFQLRASIVEVLPPRKYSFGIGQAEGVYVDDIYELLEVRLTPDGDETFRSVGYTRITNVGDNTRDPFNYSTAAQLLGRRQGIGVVAREYPRIGYDLRLTAGFSEEIFIPATEIPLLFTDITQSVNFDLSYAYNLAPITGTSQSFLSMDIGFGIPVDFEAHEDFSAFLANVYLGYNKKYTFGGRHNIGFRLGAGIEGFRSSDGSDNSLSLFSGGGRAGMDYEFLLGPALSFTMGAGYKFTSNPFWASLEVDGETMDFIAEDSEIFLGGVFYSVGFNYSLRNAGLNLFGFLDGMRQY